MFGLKTEKKGCSALNLTTDSYATNLTLIPLLRISIFCHFGSTSFVLPIQPKDGILNRGIRVTVTLYYILKIKKRKKRKKGSDLKIPVLVSKLCARLHSLK